MKHVMVGLAAVSIAVGATACSSTQSVNTPAKPAAQEEVQAPAQVAVPAGNKLTASLQGTGVQIYQCTGGAWTLLEPAATLSDPKQDKGSVGLHFKGPVWVSVVDGSEVGATAVPGAAVKHADAIPELLLKANENYGSGVFGKVSYVQRLQTKGGLAPASSCTSGAQKSVPYSALYQFWVGGQ
jgi:hypothetical protein